MSSNFIWTTINSFCHAYEETSLQESLNRLYADLDHQDPKLWAQELYVTLRDADLSSPTHVRAMMLNRDRKKCLQVLYDLVDAWESSPSPNDFEQAIAETCVPQVYRILFIGLIMDRAQALHNMKIPTVTYHGMHWYAKQHLCDQCTFITAQEQQTLTAALVHYRGSPTLNRRLHKAVHTESFGLLQNYPHLGEWTKPRLATFVHKSIGGPVLSPHHNDTFPEPVELT